MTKTDLIRNNIEQNNGYLFMSKIEDFGISRTYILRYVKDNELERVAKGIYITGETWPDILYIYCIRNPQIIYSGETALYLHSLIDREYSDICVSVPSGYNGSRLREKGVIVHQERDGIYGLGMTDCETQFGNTALKEYMRRKDRDLNKLIKYAEVLKMREEVMKYVEVMV